MTAVIADAELVERSRRRDASAFGELVERHQQLVFGVALARCHDPALAEDLAQEAFVAAWRDLDRLRDADRVGSWVAGIARNLAANAVRARGRHPVDHAEIPELEAPSPEAAALEREDRELLHRALADVPEAHREALVLYYLHGESIAEIAAALDIRENLVKQRLSRGRRALRDSVAARVESALTRARLPRAFRAGVVGALATTALSKTATAGKVIVGMSTKQIAAGVIAVIVLAGGVVWLGTSTRASGTAGTSNARDPSHAVASGAADSPHHEPARLHVERLASPTARASLLAKIRETRDRRTAGSPASGVAAPALPEADLDKDYIRGAVRELIPLLLGCYEEGLARDPKLAGTIVVDFTIEGEPGVGGVVGESTIDAADSDLADRAVDECIQETMYALEIDAPSGGGIVRVHYPFAFAPDRSDAAGH